MTNATQLTDVPRGNHDDRVYDGFLDSFHPSERQYHNCSACRHFIQRFTRARR
jgi:hypothetical protein